MTDLHDVHSTGGSALDENARAALRLVPHAKAVMDSIRQQLPPGTHFGLLLLSGDEQSRVVALTTDRQIVARAAARWVAEVLPG